jgi:hypothetical protein
MKGQRHPFHSFHEAGNILKLGIPALMQIKTFAQKIGIAPSVVVGMLQKDGIISWSTGNNIKVFYRRKISRDNFINNYYDFLKR